MTVLEQKNIPKRLLGGEKVYVTFCFLIFLYTF